VNLIECHRKNSRDIWHALEVAHEGTNQGNTKFLNFKKDRNMKESSKEVFRCCKCNKTGHIKVECPLFQNKKEEPLS
jgi:hypothetical protein